MKARDLAQWLMQEPEAVVAVTWEGTIQVPTLYPGAAGVLLLDADREMYREAFEGKATRDMIDGLNESHDLTPDTK